MKNRKVNALGLNKKMVSKLNSNEVTGGYRASALSRCNDGCISRFYQTACGE